MRRTVLVVILLVSMLLASKIIYVNANEVNSVPIVDYLPSKVIGTHMWNSINYVQSVNPNTIYVYNGNTLYRLIINKNDMLEVVAKLNTSEPLKILESKKRIFIVLKDGKLLITNLALLPLSSPIEIGNNPSFSGESNKWYAFVTDTNVLMINPSKDKYMIYTKESRDLVPIAAPTLPKIVWIPLWKLVLACSIGKYSHINIFFNNTITYIIFEGNRSSYVAKLTFKDGAPTLLSCKKFNGIVKIKNNQIIINSADFSKILIHNITIVVRNAENAEILNIVKSKLGYNVALLKFKKLGKDYIVSISMKRSEVLAAISDEKLLCAAPYIPNICFGSSMHFKPTEITEYSIPNAILTLEMTKKLRKLITSPIVVASLLRLSTGDRYSLVISTSKTVELPCSVYELQIRTRIGKVLEFVTLAPPSDNFDPPPVYKVLISPEAVIPYIYKLTVYVYGKETKRPLPGSSVIIEGRSVRGKFIKIGPLITDNEGKVSIYLEKGTYTITASHKYYITQRKVIVHDRPEVVKIYLPLNGIPTTFIVMSKGALPFIPKGPIPNAEIVINGTLISLATRTNEKGLARVTLLPGVYTVHVYAPQHRNITDTLTVAPGRTSLTVKYTLTPILYNVTLIVKDALTNRAITPDTVTVTSLTKQKSKVLKGLITNVITLSLPPDIYEIKVVAKGYQPYKKVIKVNKNIELTIPLKLKMVKVKVLVFDELRRPVPSYNVTFVNTYLGLKFKFSLTTTNNTIAIPPGTYTVTVTAKGFEPLVTTVIINENTKVIQLTIAHKSFAVTIKAETKIKLLYDFISYCTGEVRGGPFFKPLPLPKMTKPDLSATLKLPRGSYQAIIRCYSFTNTLAATGTQSFAVPIDTLVKVPLRPVKVPVTIRVQDVRNNKPVARAVVKIYADKHFTKLIGEGMTNVAGIARVMVPIYYIGRTVWLYVTAPGYQDFRGAFILARNMPAIYLKPTPTIIEVILGNPILLLVLVIAAGAGAYLISLLVGRKEEEEEIFEELV